MNKVASLVLQESGVLMVQFVDSMVVTCVDLERAKEVVEIGVGGLVQLFNVKSTTRGRHCKERSEKMGRSGASSASTLASSAVPASEGAVQVGMHSVRSRQLSGVCGYARKQGPMYKDARFCERK